VRAIGWLNVALTVAVGFFVPDAIAAFVIGSFWIVLALASTQITAWRMDVLANPTIRERLDLAP
jgi:hypothetical protein